MQVKTLRQIFEPYWVESPFSKPEYRRLRILEYLDNRHGNTCCTPNKFADAQAQSDGKEDIDTHVELLKKIDTELSITGKQYATYDQLQTELKEAQHRVEQEEQKRLLSHRLATSIGYTQSGSMKQVTAYLTIAAAVALFGYTSIQSKVGFYAFIGMLVTTVAMFGMFGSFTAWYYYRKKLEDAKKKATEPQVQMQESVQTENPTPENNGEEAQAIKIEQEKKRIEKTYAHWDCGVFPSLATAGLVTGAYAYFVIANIASLEYAAAIGAGAGALGGLLFDSLIRSDRTYAALPHVLNMLVTGSGAALGLMAAQSLTSVLATTELFANMGWSMTLVLDICVVSIAVYLTKGLANPLYQAIADKELPQIY